MMEAVSAASNPKLPRGHRCPGTHTHETAGFSAYPFISGAITFCKMKRDFSSFMGERIITPAPVLVSLLLLTSQFLRGVGG